MSLDYPLHFEPIFRRYLWGGQRLGTLLGKKIGAGRNCAESWEIVDHGADQSIVTNGPLAGYALSELNKKYPLDLYGAKAPLQNEEKSPHFPLLFKFLCAQQKLSVQVHPNDEHAAKLSPPDLGKTEAWIVLDAEPGSTIYAGLKQGVDRNLLEEAVRNGTCETLLHAFTPNVGDCIFIPAGTVHAIGAGLLIAEIQQASDTTYRLFDWNRTDAEGKPRPLHIEAALNVIDFESGPVDATPPELMDAATGVEELVRSDYFVVLRRQVDETQVIGGDDRFHLLAVLSGEIAIEAEHQPNRIAKGHVVLLPAAAGEIRVRAMKPAVLLDIFLPENERKK